MIMIKMTTVMMVMVMMMMVMMTTMKMMMVMVGIEYRSLHTPARSITPRGLLYPCWHLAKIRNCSSCLASIVFLVLCLLAHKGICVDI